MNSSEWDANKTLLWTIIKECIDDENMCEYTDLIYKNFEHTTSHLFNKQYEFDNLTVLNKYVINNINKKMGIIKMNNTTNVNTTNANNTINTNNTTQHSNDIFIQPQDVIYTRKDLQTQRQNMFKEKLSEKQKELDLYNARPQKNIDFSDKTSEKMDNIDNLLEQEMEKRTREMNIIMNENNKTNTKNVKKWIHSSNNDSNNDTNNDSNNDNHNSKIIIHDKPHKISDINTTILKQTPHINKVNKLNKPIKKVTFSDINIQSGIKDETNNFLTKLKSIKHNSNEPNIPKQNVNINNNDLYNQLIRIQNQLNDMTIQISNIQNYITKSSTSKSDTYS